MPNPYLIFVTKSSTFFATYSDTWRRRRSERKPQEFQWTSRGLRERRRGERPHVGGGRRGAAPRPVGQIPANSMGCSLVPPTRGGPLQPAPASGAFSAKSLPRT